jgi:hypothetical protein
VGIASAAGVEALLKNPGGVITIDESSSGFFEEGKSGLWRF